MFILYAVPPVRLKTRGFPGVIADAGYAHALPILWTWFPFAIVARIPLSTAFPAILAVWAMAVGMRHLMQHQAFESAEDTAAGTRTFAVRHGAARTFSLVVRVLIPVELAAFLIVLIYMSFDLPVIAVVFVIYCAFEAFRFRVLWLQRLNILAALSRPDRATIVGTLILSQFYELWLPVTVLSALAFRAPAYVFLLAIYLLVFRNGPGQFLRRDVPQLSAWMRGRRSKAAVVNSAIVMST
jgi:hypothetical protein